jgi:hypothetical protein
MTFPERSNWGQAFLLLGKPGSEAPLWTLCCKDIYDCQVIYNSEGIYCSRDGSG